MTLLLIQDGICPKTANCVFEKLLRDEMHMLTSFPSLHYQMHISKPGRENTPCVLSPVLCFEVQMTSSPLCSPETSSEPLFTFSHCIYPEALLKCSYPTPSPEKTSGDRPQVCCLPHTTGFPADWVLTTCMTINSRYCAGDLHQASCGSGRKVL